MGRQGQFLARGWVPGSLVCLLPICLSPSGRPASAPRGVTPSFPDPPAPGQVSPDLGEVGPGPRLLLFLTRPCSLPAEPGPAALPRSQLGPVGSRRPGQRQG